MGKFRHLLHTLRAKRFIRNGDVDHTIMLFLHCATNKIWRELERLLQAYCDYNEVKLFGGNGAFRMPFASKGQGSLEVKFNLLPADGAIESVWHNTDDLPWQGIHEELDTYNEQFVVTRTRGRRSHGDSHLPPSEPDRDERSEPSANPSA